MVNTQFERGVSESKRDFFKRVVEDTSAKFNVKIPEVKFWNCPDFNGKELAHCHMDRYLICISDRVLNLLDNDELYDLATHEATHLLHGEHDSNFYDVHESFKIASFKIFFTPV